MQYPTSLGLFILLRVNYVYMKISCRFEISFRSKWPIWNPYRFEFHFALIHVSTKKRADWTQKWDFQPKWNLILVWVHFAPHVNVLIKKLCIKRDVIIFSSLQLLLKVWIWYRCQNTYQNKQQKEGCSCNLYIIARNKELQFIWQKLY